MKGDRNHWLKEGRKEEVKSIAIEEGTNATGREGMESDLSECPQSALLHQRLKLGTSSA